MSKSLRRAFYCIGLAFLGLFTWLFFMVNIAFEIDEPVLDTSYYKKGMNYQKRIDGLKKGREAGYLLESKIFSTGQANQGEIPTEFLLRGPDESFPREVDFQVRMERPASIKGRKIIRLKLADARRQSAREYVFPATLQAPLPGYWEIHVEVNLGADAILYRRHRIYVTPAQNRAQNFNNNQNRQKSVVLAEMRK